MKLIPSRKGFDATAGGRRRDDRVELRSVARGQELVLDADHDPEAAGWLRALRAYGTSSSSPTT